MPSADHLTEIRNRIQVQIEKAEKEGVALDTAKLNILAQTVIAARLCEILEDLCMITSVAAKEMRTLREMTAGKIQEAMREMEDKPIIYKPH